MKDRAKSKRGRKSSSVFNRPGRSRNSALSSPGRSRSSAPKPSRSSNSNSAQQPKPQPPTAATGPTTATADSTSPAAAVKHPAATHQEQAQTWQQPKGSYKHGGWPAHASWQQDRSQNWASDHRTWAQRGGYGGYYIPQDRFNLYFGDQHFFRLGAVPVMYLGYPRFEDGGFSFLLVDPWPESWAANWYASDDVYIGYNNGYYLYDRRYPQTALAITIVL